MKLLKQISLIVLATVVPLAGCNTDNLQDLNINPQTLPSVDMNFLFTAAELGTAAGGSAGDNRYIDWRTNIGFAAHVVQQLANVTGGIAPGDKYTHNVESYNAPWEFIYGDQLKNLKEVLSQTGPEGPSAGRLKKTREAARILRAFNFHRLTDYYGNIPYSNALKGLPPDGILLPSYDTQEEIYTDLLKELSEAVAAINAADLDDGFANADIIFNGDVAKWKKWGNSLILRLAMRMSYVPGKESMVAQYVSQAVAGGTMATNADNVWVPMASGPSQWVNQNGISRAFLAGDGGQPALLSRTLTNKLMGPDLASTDDDDPRLMIISGGRLNADGSYNKNPLEQRGLPNGLDAGMMTTLLNNEVGPTPPGGWIQAREFSRLNQALLDIDDPYQLMNAAESEFLKAEAIVRGIGTVPGTAQEHYEAGVKLAMQMFIPYAQGSAAVASTLTVTDQQVADYLVTYPFPATADAQLQAIGEQMWVSKLLNWWDAWADWRRTGYPQLVPTTHPSSVTNGVIPTKLRLPTHEQATNASNIQANGTLPDEITTKVWWDVKD